MAISCSQNFLLIRVVFVCLFSAAMSSSDYTALTRRTIIELERMWRESVVAYFNALSQNLPGGTEENHEQLREAP
jgi:hypothetical protein